jgi:hypothetical protein
MNMEQWWSDTDRENPKKQLGEKLVPEHFVPHSSHAEWLGIEPGLPPLPVTVQ